MQVKRRKKYKAPKLRMFKHLHTLTRSCATVALNTKRKGQQQEQFLPEDQTHRLAKQFWTQKENDYRNYKNYKKINFKFKVCYIVLFLKNRIVNSLHENIQSIRSTN